MLDDLLHELVAAWGSWAPALSPDGQRVAFISDRRERPELWVQDIPQVDTDPLPPAIPLAVSDDPVVAVSWSADGEWLACAVAFEGGVRTQCWLLRPDGSDAHRVAAEPGRHVALGPWTRRGHRIVVMIPPVSSADISHCDLVDPETGEREPLARGGLVNVLSLSVDERFALLRDGTRGAHFCVTLDRELDRDHPLLPYPETGTTEEGVLRPAPDGAGLSAYLVTDAGQPRAALAAVAVDVQGIRGQAGILAARADGELEHIDADDGGRLLTLVWNIGGRSVLELLEPATGKQIVVDQLPGQVISACVLARDGRSAVACIEGPRDPQQLWRLDIASRAWRRLTESPSVAHADLVEPVLVEFDAHDGLPLCGWLYRRSDEMQPGPVLISLHGGPESEERPTFSPNHQGVVAAGVSVFAPNVRGSAGFGRGFAHADDRYGRHDAIADVRSCVRYLVESGVADATRIAVSGRSYGGYLTLAALTSYPDLFASGVDICGMSDLLAFFRDTEPWIAAAAVTKYGDPRHDRALLEDLSPLWRADRIKVPVLVIHGEHDTNVPLDQATQIVEALRSAGREVDYLQLPGEGHEYRARASRLLLVERLVGFLTETLGTGSAVDR